MPETLERLADKLREEGNKTLAFFQAIHDDQWEQQIYTDGSHWNIRKILAHLAEAETSLNSLLKNILNGGSGVPEGFDIDRYNESHVPRLDGLAIDELMALYENSRKANILLVSGMRPEELNLQGRHPFLGMTTIEEILKMLYRHNQLHQRDIRRAIAGWEANRIIPNE